MFVPLAAIIRKTPDGAAANVAQSIVFPQPPPVVVKASANIAADAATATTAQLTAPSGKTSGADFQAGKISDDVNALAIPPIDLASGKYTELEWSFTTQGLLDGDVVQFRVTAFGKPLDSYPVIPELTIGSGVTATSFPFSTGIPLSMLTM